MVMNRRTTSRYPAWISILATLALSLVILNPATLVAQEDPGTPTALVVVKAVPAGLPIQLGELLLGAEMTQTRPRLSETPIGPYPVFINDINFFSDPKDPSTCDDPTACPEEHDPDGECTWSAAAATGISQWFGINRRGNPCLYFQQSVSAISSAGGDGNIVGNNVSGSAVVGTAAGPIPGMMISEEDSFRMVDTIKAISHPNDFRVTLEQRTLFLGEETDLPPPPPGYTPPDRGNGFGFGFGEGGLSDFGGGFGEFGEGDVDGDTEVILVPGPDGELIEIEIPTYAEAAGEQAGFNPLIPITVAVVLLAFLLGGFFFIRSRRQEEAEGLY